MWGGGYFRKPNLGLWRAKLKRDREKRMDEFAGLLAEGFTISEASAAMGIAQQTGSALLKSIKERLGPQAYG